MAQGAIEACQVKSVEHAGFVNDDDSGGYEPAAVQAGSAAISRLFVSRVDSNTARVAVDSTAKSAEVVQQVFCKPVGVDVV